MRAYNVRVPFRIVWLLRHVSVCNALRARVRSFPRKHVSVTKHLCAARGVNMYLSPFCYRKIHRNTNNRVVNKYNCMFRGIANWKYYTVDMYHMSYETNMEITTFSSSLLDTSFNFFSFSLVAEGAYTSMLENFFGMYINSV